MEKINLRNFYAWYTQDEYIEVPDEVAEELMADKRYEQSHQRSIRRNKVDPLEENHEREVLIVIGRRDSPEQVYERMERYCNLCRALNSLPEVQGRRIELHYLLGMTQREIARSEGVSERNVRHSIRKGLVSMKKFLEKI